MALFCFLPQDVFITVNQGLLVNAAHQFGGFDCDTALYHDKCFHVIDVGWIVGCLATAIGVDSLPFRILHLLESQLLDKVDDWSITYDFGIPDGHKQIAVPQKLLDGLVVLVGSVFQGFVVDVKYLVGVDFALVILKVADLVPQDIEWVGFAHFISID